jgi:ribosome biogenesis GTPase / thiamine phosphate phosphatase
LSSSESPVPSLLSYGWSDRWRALLTDHDAAEPARVLRHDGTAYLLATPHGISQARIRPQLRPEPAVGDWLACRDGDVVAVLPRSSLLRRRDVGGEREQQLAANVDLVLLVCGLDRPVKPGRILRGATLAWDAGATPAVVLTKAAVPADVDATVRRVQAENPALDVIVTSAHEGVGLDDVRALIGDRTVVMLGESGAGKSSLLNALLCDEAASIGRVRTGDAKGRHTTTARELRPLPSGGVLIDTPGIRAVGLWVDPDAVSMTFADIDEIGSECRFRDCEHGSEPGCAVIAAVEAGELAAERLESWQSLRREAESAARRAVAHERHAYERQFGRITREAQKRKGR